MPVHPPQGPAVQGAGGTRPRLDVDVLVVGAGPTGLTAASEALRHGLSVRIIDRKPDRSAFSKALVVHARTMEVFETMGMADAILAEGTRFAALNVHAGRRDRAVRIDLLAQPWGDTAYPFWLSVPQYATEQALEAHLGKLGGRVEWRVSLDGLRDLGDHVEARLTTEDGADEVVRSRWLIGCDGGRSRVRDQAGLRLDRSATGATFILADVKTTASLPEDEGHVFLGRLGPLLIVPMPEPGRWRVIARVEKLADDPPADTDAAGIDAAYLDELIRRRAGIEFGGHEVTWRSRFDLSDGLADRYRRGRVFLAGDAAHVHSPVGGQGLNTGVQDAHNLLWKLAAAREMDPARADALLDTYERERRPVARAMVKATSRMTRVLSLRSHAVRALLDRIAPHVIARPAVQAKLGRNVGMLEIAYPPGPGTSRASVRVGHRMPNPALRAGGRLYRLLDPTGHTWVVWGDTPPDQGPPPGGHPVVFVPDDAIAEVDRPPVTGRVVLVRPDRYVAAETWHPPGHDRGGERPLPDRTG